MKWADLTPETIAKTEQWYIDNALRCIAEAESGLIKPNNLDSFREWQMQTVNEMKNKTYKPSFAFLQKAWYIQTGEEFALLP